MLSSVDIVSIMLVTTIRNGIVGGIDGSARVGRGANRTQKGVSCESWNVHYRNLLLTLVHFDELKRSQR